MSKPIPNAPISELTFPQRLELVKAEIEARLASHPKDKQNALRASYWRRWLMRNVLEVPA